MNYSELGKDRKYLSIICLFVLIFFWKTFFMGFALSGADIVTKWYYPWAAKPELQQETFFEKKPFKYLNNILKDVGIGIDSRRPSNPEISDPAFGHIPAVKNSVDMIKKGHPPLWNPYTACGLPQMAAGNFSPFYPLNLLFLLPGINVIWAETIKILLQFLLFSVGIFYLCRLINLSGFASLVVTVAFCFSTCVINWISFSSLDSLFLFPFILIFIEKFLVTKKYKYLFYE